MKTFHHGYLLAGDVERGRKEALKMAGDILGADEKKLSAHPDFTFFKKTPFSIGDARTIRENSSRKSFFGSGRVFVIETGIVTREASNALLKTMEEPEGLSYFFIITSSSENVLDTLRSRLMVLYFNNVDVLPSAKINFVKKFLKNNPDKRLEMVNSFADEQEKVLSFFDCLEKVLHDEEKDKVLAKNLKLLDILMKQRTFARRRGSSPKMILEYLSFVLPQM